MSFVAFMLVGGLVAAVGLAVSALGAVSVAAGYGLGHVGGWVLVAYGFALTALGVWAARFGRRGYRKLSQLA
jgi:hypothetical protein